MTTYSANGLGHRILTRLAQAPAFFGEIRPVSGMTRRATKNAHHLMMVLVRDHLVRESRRGYEITEDGADALEQLNGGQDFSAATPTVRVYGMRAQG